MCDTILSFSNMKFGFSLLLMAAIMVEDHSAQKLRLENWMGDLPDPIKDMPLIFLAIPGSHDSMTYGITRSSTVAPDAEPILNRLYPLFRGTILRWTITQASDTWQQLLIGIRYFDLRLATKAGDDKFYFTHGLYGDEISMALGQIRKFVDSHPGEVIVVYRNETVNTTGEFWQPQMMPSPWPRQDSITGLLNFLTNIRRNPSTGFVHQAVLTPTPTFILLRWISSLRQKCAVPVINEVLPKLAEFSPGPPAPHLKAGARSTVNVVIADFVDMDDAIFPRTIIDLNMKLLRHTELVHYG
ncbi:PI-PLC X domain-containing protein 3 isoform X3 [Spodoptera litura]|uniref:PI-PLC X domain-containing protein 3 isoform X3 n=1 Tax=Spodoptera litura TaxID=69820 RepID=A0A9J7IR95_SPOLT|nr:PI-PLC X domain-containing protein 3 isoform X3 [Spodoptera litura]